MAPAEWSNRPMARGRTPGFVMSHEHRSKIQNSQILNALIEHAEGRRDMSASQVSAGLGLLKKVMPDLSQMQMDASVTTSHEEALDELDGEGT